MYPQQNLQQNVQPRNV